MSRQDDCSSTTPSPSGRVLQSQVDQNKKWPVGTSSDAGTQKEIQVESKWMSNRETRIAEATANIPNDSMLTGLAKAQTKEHGKAGQAVAESSSSRNTSQEKEGNLGGAHSGLSLINKRYAKLDAKSADFGKSHQLGRDETDKSRGFLSFDLQSSSDSDGSGYYCS